MDVCFLVCRVSKSSNVTLEKSVALNATVKSVSDGRKHAKHFLNTNLWSGIFVER